MTSKKRSSKSLYSPHPSLTMVQKWIEQLPEKTGRSLEEWIALLEKSKAKDDDGRRRLLVEKHDVDQDTAEYITARSFGRRLEDSEPDAYLEAAAAWVEAMYADKKAPLRPLHDALIAMALDVDRTLRICPCRTIVPLFKKNVVAQIKPSTRTRIDFGLALGDAPAKGRLISTGGFAKKDRITHRVAITSLDEIDDELRSLLERAIARN